MTNDAIAYQNVLDFFTAALKDQAMLAQLEVAIENNDTAAIIQMAERLGYHFSEPELKTGFGKILELLIRAER